MTTIEIHITPDGKTNIQTKGFSGPACREASRFIEDALGKRLSERLTTDFHQTLPVEQHRQQTG